MAAPTAPDARLLLLDTCGQRAFVALFSGTELLAEAALEERTASANLLGAVRAILDGQGLSVPDLDGVGVVRGPGSFTGVRIGMAMAKGLCEASGLPIAGVSRLAVLAQAADLQGGFALLSAGREQVYVRVVGGEAGPQEFLADLAILQPRFMANPVAVASPELALRLRGQISVLRQVDLLASHAIGEVRSCFARGGSSLSALDANYVRNEDAMYRQVGGRGTPKHG